MINALTFDIEEYFHAEVFSGVVRPEEWASRESRVVGVTEQLLELLQEARTAATFFVLGWVADRYPGLVRAIAAGGHEVACHGYAHQMITRLSRCEFSQDIRRAKAAVEDAAGAAVIGYRAPTFSVVRETLWSLEVLAEAGFQYDSSIFPIVHGVRSLALRQHIGATSTVARLDALVAAGRLPADLATDLADALHFLMGLRLKAGLEELDTRRPVSGGVQLDRLSSLERDLLKDALAVVKRFKALVRHQFHLEAV